MTESKNCLTPVESLKQEIDLRYRILCYKKLHENYILNRFEKNNYNTIISTIEDINFKHNMKKFKELNS